MASTLSLLQLPLYPYEQSDQWPLDNYTTLCRYHENTKSMSSSDSFSPMPLRVTKILGWIILTLALGFNATFIIIFARISALRAVCQSPRLWLLFALCFADLLYAGFILPADILVLSAHDGCWPLGPTACHTFIMSSNALWLLPHMLLLMICFDQLVLMWLGHDQRPQSNYAVVVTWSVIAAEIMVAVFLAAIVFTPTELALALMYRNKHNGDHENQLLATPPLQLHEEVYPRFSFDSEPTSKKDEVGSVLQQKQVHSCTPAFFALDCAGLYENLASLIPLSVACLFFLLSLVLFWCRRRRQAPPPSSLTSTSKIACALDCRVEDDPLPAVCGRRPSDLQTENGFRSSDGIQKISTENDKPKSSACYFSTTPQLFLRTTLIYCASVVLIHVVANAPYHIAQLMVKVEAEMTVSHMDAQRERLRKQIDSGILPSLTERHPDTSTDNVTVVSIQLDYYNYWWSVTSLLMLLRWSQLFLDPLALLLTVPEVKHVFLAMLHALCRFVCCCCLCCRQQNEIEHSDRRSAPPITSWSNNNNNDGTVIVNDEINVSVGANILKAANVVQQQYGNNRLISRMTAAHVQSPVACNRGDHHHRPPKEDDEHIDLTQLKTGRKQQAKHFYDSPLNGNFNSYDVNDNNSTNPRYYYDVDLTSSSNAQRRRASPTAATATTLLAKAHLRTLAAASTTSSSSRSSAAVTVPFTTTTASSSTNNNVPPAAAAAGGYYEDQRRRYNPLVYSSAAAAPNNRISTVCIHNAADRISDRHNCQHPAFSSEHPGDKQQQDKLKQAAGSLKLKQRLYPQLTTAMHPDAEMCNNNSPVPAAQSVSGTSKRLYGQNCIELRELNNLNDVYV